MSGKQRKSYSLVAPISAEYERNKGPMPSGYAKVFLTLEPCVDSPTSSMVVETDLDRSWQLLEVRSATGDILKISPEIEGGLQREAVTGISDGAKAALQDYLDAPLVQVKIVVHEIGFHPVYSTIMAFKIVGERAVELALEKARRQGIVVAIQHEDHSS